MFQAILGAISLGLQAAGNKKNRRAEKKAKAEAKAAAEFEATQLEGKARDEMAAGSYRIEDQKKEGELVKSRARALGAASGAGGYEDTIADIDAESEYRTLFSLYNSKQSARDLELAAYAARRHGADTARAIAQQGRADRYESAIGMLNGVSSLYERFGKPYKPSGGYDTTADINSNALANYEAARYVS